ncbi:hypothetical protein K9O30_09755 [Clostridium bowmanii]|uniref:hypothetical protein n=1 Tax=Clostridium bowmanii TaxID=132925 RepID=UPI001C0BA955|nr:hypothetical protein [Clostridium bowmanii]MBU3189383.1 hypothetical protein [Clostridium bowmanii]MCA1073997.1 hypothetical protein [Clostridium bowmanii]
MEIKEKNVSKKLSKSTFSTVMYVFAAVAGVFGIALLINNMILFKSTVSQAVAQGYAIATVKKALLTSQLIPGIIEPIGTYGGIALILLGVGKVNKKVSKCLSLLTKVEVGTDVIEEIIVEPNVVDLENVEVTEEIKTSEHTETI